MPLRVEGCAHMEADIADASLRPEGEHNQSVEFPAGVVHRVRYQAASLCTRRHVLNRPEQAPPAANLGTTESDESKAALYQLLSIIISLSFAVAKYQAETRQLVKLSQDLGLISALVMFGWEVFGLWGTSARKWGLWLLQDYVGQLAQGGCYWLARQIRGRQTPDLEIGSAGDPGNGE